MTPERWQRRIAEVFSTALERDPGERDDFLAAACDGDPKLLAEVRSLVAADGAAASFLEDTVEAEVERLVADPRAPRAGQRIGPYRLLRGIGEGGMSTVYLAARADREFQHLVALKIIRRDLDSHDIQRRFERERQILASLKHPNIAQLHDGGRTDEGRPFFVMEYIEGLPIDRYCDAHRLSIRQRLELFRPICSAVQEAHRNLVVHRDLKPSNILVTAAGVPKLLDFGIAKLLAPESFPQTIVPTALPLRVMTPEYASPEQARGEAITTASDVYSLGVLLYELLSGQRPYRIARRSPAETERLICETEPERPSQAIDRVEPHPDDDDRGTPTPETATLETVSSLRATQPATLRRQLAGDLDNIVLKALRKRPQRRYASVEQLSEDLRRHLRGLPVQARQDTLGYRARKFVSRHRAGVAAASLSAMALVASALATGWQARLARAAQERAEIERDTAEQTASFLEELFLASDPRRAGSSPLTTRELLERGARRIPTELEGQPEIQARLLHMVGRTFRKLGHHADAEPLLRQALEVRREALGEEHPAVAESLDALASLLHANDDDAAAEPLYRQALEMRRGLLGERHEEVAVSLNNLAELLHSRGDYADAEPLLRQALAIRQTLPESEPRHLAEVRNNLASLLATRGNLAAAEQLHRETLEQRRGLYGEQHLSVAESLNNLAAVIYRQGDPAKAEPLFRQALALRRNLLEGPHPELARSLNNLAKILFVQQRYVAAEPLFREALQLKRELYGAQHSSVEKSLHSHAQVLHALERHAEAQPLYREALRARRLRLPARHLLIAESLLGLGELLLDIGEIREAEPLLREALESRRAASAASRRIAEAESALGGALAGLGRLDEAEPLLARGAAVLERELGRESRPAQRARQRLAELLD